MACLSQANKVTHYPSHKEPFDIQSRSSKGNHASQELDAQARRIYVMAFACVRLLPTVFVCSPFGQNLGEHCQPRLPHGSNTVLRSLLGTHGQQGAIKLRGQALWFFRPLESLEAGFCPEAGFETPPVLEDIVALAPCQLRTRVRTKA